VCFCSVSYETTDHSWFSHITSCLHAVDLTEVNGIKTTGEMNWKDVMCVICADIKLQGARGSVPPESEERKRKWRETVLRE